MLYVALRYVVVGIYDLTAACRFGARCSRLTPLLRASALDVPVVTMAPVEDPPQWEVSDAISLMVFLDGDSFGFPSSEPGDSSPEWETEEERRARGELVGGKTSPFCLFEVPGCDRPCGAVPPFAAYAE
ncbi:hypothetical protein EOD39_15805 [Acipenser ruthenus]|uniref:Uncharacterized protein n=1 Tax=Acipenser ruthenus TaxID=7906 RepID=A0A444UC25_ACIRT|nr:hypothetical protein EOD39_15805 [Acipenser ruthenus]